MESPTTEGENPSSDRDAVDAILKLADASWRDFDSRRSHEIKVSFALWTALALLAGIVLKGDVKLSVDSLQFILLAGILLGIWVVYSFIWTPGLRERQVRNLESAHFYWDRAEDILARSLPRSVWQDNSPRLKWGEAERASLGQAKSGRSLKHWSHGSQFLMTTFLMLLVIWCVWVRN